MSAVSSESPLATADLSAPSANPSSPNRSGESAEPGTAPGSADFGANEWLVEDMYERYLNDPNSVDAAWHDFFADYRSSPGRSDDLLEVDADGSAGADVRVGDGSAPAGGAPPMVSGRTCCPDESTKW